MRRERERVAAMALRSRTELHFRVIQTRTFINAKVKWVRDPDLDFVVEREKNLRQAVSLSNQILSSPSKSLPLSTASLLKPHFNLPTNSTKFFHKYPSLFTEFQPGPGLPPHVKLTPRALLLHKEESAIHNSQTQRTDTVNRLVKLLMLAGSGKLPLNLIERFKWDLGLPHDYILTLLTDYPDYFQISSNGDEILELELVSRRNELAESELENRNGGKWNNLKIYFPMNFPNGFDLEKKVKDWMEEWQGLPYISPYENAFHLTPNSDQAEKWTVGSIHELLWILASKKTEKDNLICWGEHLGFDSRRLKKALVHHPGIFYVSNKIRTQTVVLREAYRKDFLIQKHPLMGIRYRYIHLMNKAVRRKRKQSIS